MIATAILADDPIDDVTGRIHPIWWPLLIPTFNEAKNGRIRN